MSNDRQAHAHAGPGLWIGLAIGVPIMARGVLGILEGSRRTHPGELARWIAGSAIIHDAVLLPIVVGVAMIVRSVVPARTWPIVRWALMTSGVVLLVAWPFVRGYGRRAGNPSLLPRNYGVGVAVALAITWAVAAALVVLGRRRARRVVADPSVDQ